MKVAILMGSASDADSMAAAEEYLAFFGIEFETNVMSEIGRASCRERVCVGV